MPYKEESNMILRAKLEILEHELPPICKEFFNAKASLVPSTAYAYAHKLLYFFMFLQDTNPYFKNKEIPSVTHTDLAMLKVTDFEEFIRWLKYHKDEEHVEKNTKKNGIHTCSVNTVRSYIACLNTFYNFLVKRGYAKENPIKDLELPKKETKEEVVRLYSHEKQALMNTITTGAGLEGKQLIFHEKNKIRDTAIFQLFLDTGLRIAELQGINVEDINFFEHYVYCARKRVNDAEVFFSDYTEKCLLDYLEIRDSYYPIDGENALFLSCKGTRISIRTLQTMTKKYSRAAITDKKNITPHRLRATFATDLLNVTDNMEIVRSRMGHQSIQTTSLYVDTNKEQSRATRNMLYKNPFND